MVALLGVVPERYRWWVALPIVLVLAVAWRFRPRRQTPNAWRRGSEGERRTAEVLKQLPRGYVVLHDVAMGTSRANIDHVVIGPSGVFVLDSKHWTRAAAPSRYGWKYGVLLEPQAEVTLKETAFVVESLEPEVSKWRVPVATYWVMTNAQQPFDALGEVRVISLAQLIPELTQAPTVLRSGQVRRLVAHANEVFRAR